MHGRPQGVAHSTIIAHRFTLRDHSMRRSHMTNPPPHRLPPWVMITAGVLLAIPVLALLLVPVYARTGPGTLGIPVLLLVPVPLGRDRGRVHLQRATSSSTAPAGATAHGARCWPRGTRSTASALSVLLFFFVIVTVGGFLRSEVAPAGLDARHWTSGASGGRGFGTVVTWFLLGGDLYTAYTFVAVPAAMYATGAVSRLLRGAVHDRGVPADLHLHAPHVVGRAPARLRDRRPTSSAAATALGACRSPSP